MTIISQDQFLSITQEVFSPVFREYGFELAEEVKNLAVAKRGDIELIFRLEFAYHTCYFGVEIRLSGELGERASAETRYRHLGVTAIARCLDPRYARPVRGAGNVEELREIADDHREELTKYCRSILLGDVSQWQRVVNCLMSNSIKQEQANHP